MCAEALRAQVAEAVWKAWFEGITPVGMDGEGLTLAVPNAVVRERIEGRYLGMVHDAVAKNLGHSTAIRLEIRAPEAETEADVETYEGLGEVGANGSNGTAR